MNVELKQLLDRTPTLGYTREEIEQLLKFNAEYAVDSYACLAKALLYDETLFKDYHREAERFFDKIVSETDLFTCATVKLLTWYHLLQLHPQCHPTLENFRSFVQSLSLFFDKMSDPLLATKYLDYAFDFVKRELNAPDMEVVLRFLSKHGAPDEFAYYKGVCGLFLADYELAFNAFCQGSDQRCRLAQAYCLINGIGTVGDCPAGLRILEDYPQVAYALYLKGIGLLRADPDGAVSAESIELLMAAYEQGYRPAMYDLSILRLVHGDQFGLSNKVDIKQSMQIAMAAEDEINEAYTLVRMYFRTKEAFKKEVADEQRAHRSLQSDEPSEFQVCDEVYCDYEKHIGNVQLPLWAYTRYFGDRTRTPEIKNESLRKGVLSFCQSPGIRRWATFSYFFNTIENRECADLSFLTLQLRRMGLTEKELVACVRYWQFFSARNYGMSFQSMAEGFVEDNAGTDSPFIKLLLARLYTDGHFNMYNRKKVLGYLNETMQVQGTFLKAFHNSITNKLSSNVHLIPLDAREWYEPEKDDWLKELVGYSFFDYLMGS